MTSFPNSPQLLKGGIVLIDPEYLGGAAHHRAAIQPGHAQPHVADQRHWREGGDRSEALRLTGPPVETIKLDAEIDATDQLEFPRTEPERSCSSVFIRNSRRWRPSSIRRTAKSSQTTGWRSAGTLEIVPMETPLTLFIWSKNRVMPVRLTDFSITEEAFDPTLNPIRAKVSLGMRVLSVNDLPFDHKGSSLFMAYHQQKENLATKAQGGTLNALGITRIP